jgi:hypothetical protein
MSSVDRAIGVFLSPKARVLSLKVAAGELE